jgi:hypothetical protein
MRLSRRHLVTGAAALAAGLAIDPARSIAAAARRFDFTEPLDGWEIVAGKWAIENLPDASAGRALVQRAINNEFNVIVAPDGPYTDVDVSVRFKPISGREDASGGIVVRFSEGHYYVIRANALEDNFRLYYYERGRRQIAGSSVKAPTLGQWHTIRLRAEGQRLQGWLDEKALIDHRDDRYRAGRVGLWTKADSVTAFSDLTVQLAGNQ